MGLKKIAVGGMLGLTLAFSQPAIAQQDLTAEVQEAREFEREHSDLIRGLREKYGFLGFRLSPDGKRIAFASDNIEGNYEVYVSDLEGRVSNITHHSANDLSPKWVDNDTIRFLRAAPFRSGVSVYKVDIDGTNLTKLNPGFFEARKHKLYEIGGAFGALLGFYFFFDLYRRKKGERVPGFLKAIYCGLMEKSIEDLEKVRAEFPNWSSIYFSLGKRHLEEGNLDLMLENFTRAMKLRPNDLIRKIPVIGSLTLSHALERLEQKRIRKKEQIKGNIGLAMVNYVDFRFDDTILTTQSLMQQWDSVYAHAFYAYLLDHIKEIYGEAPRPVISFGETRAGKAIDRAIWRKRNTRHTKQELEEMANGEWVKVAEFVMQNPHRFEYRPVGESKNQIFIMEPSGEEFGSFSDAIILKKNSLQELEEERKFTRTLRDVIKGYEEYDFPRDITIAKSNGDYFYVMKREEGQLLYDIIQSGKEFTEELSSISKLMGIIYSKTQHTAVRQQVTNHYERLKLKLERMKAPEGTIEKLMSGLQPVFVAIEQSPVVIRKDPHPENWAIKNGKVIGFDCENLGLDHIGIDLANLFCYGKYTNFQDIGEYALSLIEAYNENSENPIDQHKLLFWVSNGVFPRAISLHELMADRPTRQHTRREITENGINFIEVIRSEFSKYYREHQNSYVNLKDGMQELMDFSFA